MFVRIAAVMVVSFVVPVMGWSCNLGAGLNLDVEEVPPFSYSVSQIGGGAWLNDGALSIFSAGVEYSSSSNASGLVPLDLPTSGSGIDPALGVYSFFSIPWQAATHPPLQIVTNFTCYASAGAGTLAVFELHFPNGLENCSIAPPPPPGNYEAGGNALPSTRFPSFAAGSADAVRNPALRFVEYAGCMSSQESSVGAGLDGYLGGQRSGPLVLLNSSAFIPGVSPPYALVLGPLDHFSNEIIAVAPSQATQPDEQCSEPPIPNRDQTGASHSPGYDMGARVSDPGACCQLCYSLGMSNCSAYVWDTTEPPVSTPNCWPTIGATGSIASSTRALGWLGQPVLAGGVQGAISALPAGFSTRFALVAAQGVTDAVYSYGAALRKAFELQRIPIEMDPLREQISYWTDNGGYYYDGYWPLYFNASNTPEEVLGQLAAYHRSEGITVGTYQLDPWWTDGFGIEPLWYWAWNWTAFPGFFPSGLAATGLPLTLYSNIWAVAPANVMTEFDWVQASACAHDCYAHVLPSQSYAFHSKIFSLGRSWGQNAFEMDFSNWMQLSFTDFNTDIMAYDEYFAGVHRAATEHGLSVQLCSEALAEVDLPSQALGTVQYPTFTNARLQGDGFPTDDSRYDIFQTSLLYGSLALAPFLDVIWTTACQPGIDNPYGTTTCCPYVEALAAIAALSAGPVGFGDGLGFTNATLLNMTARADGVLLQPSLPAVPIEAFYMATGTNGSLPPGSRIAAAPTFIPGQENAGWGGAVPYPYPAPYAWLSIIALDVSAPVTLAPNDLSPPLLPGGLVIGYVVSRLSPGLNATRVACADGMPANGCALAFSTTDPLTVLTGPPPAPRSKALEVFSIAPVFNGGWALLGELDKFVRVAVRRFVSVTPGCGTAPGPANPTLCAVLEGAAGEALNITFSAPGGILRTAVVLFGPTGGRQAIACAGLGPSSSCSSGMKVA